MEINGSWLVPTHQAAGIDLGIAPLPAGPAGKATRVNPTGAVVYAKSTEAPEAAWEFVKYLASPEAQKQIMQLKAAVPVDKRSSRASYRDVVPGRAGVRRHARVRPPQAVVRGLQRVHDGPPGRSSTRTCSTTANKTAAEAIATVIEQLNGILAANAQ